MDKQTSLDRRLLPLYAIIYEQTVKQALSEDLGRAGDLTTDAIVSPEDMAIGQIIAKTPGRIAGIDIALHAFHCLDSNINGEISHHDGSNVLAGDIIATIKGSARAILAGERTALNFLMRLSGIATVTKKVVESVAAYPANIVCTRKTTPGLRALEKYAVRAGGGANHRFGLDDAVLIKDNHIAIAGGVSEAIRRVRNHVGHMVKIEVEVDTLEQLQCALKEQIDAVLLDNMSIPMLADAIRMTQKKVITEASGGVTPETARKIAATGVDLISIGWITHSAPSLNVSLDISSAHQ
jgi:nicotinate-nucleotide pyrophosphorylase (carboxylating)